MSDDKKRWLAGRINLMLAKAEADLTDKWQKDRIRMLGPRLIKSFLASLPDTITIHTESLEKELERVKAERDQWYQQTLEHQEKLRQFMTGSGN